MFRIFKNNKKHSKGMNLVACITYGIHWTDTKDESQLLIGLYEDPYGNREFNVFDKERSALEHDLYLRSKAHIEVKKWISHCLDITNLRGVKGITNLSFSNGHKTIFEEIETSLEVADITNVINTLTDYKDYFKYWNPIIEEIKRQNPSLIGEIEVLLKLKS